MRGLVACSAREKHTSPTSRTLFRKLLKAYDEKEVQLTITSQKHQALEAQKKTTRRKVQIDPNAAFADIEAIRRAQMVSVILVMISALFSLRRLRKTAPISAT
jgi:stress-induced morphogen